MNKEIIKPVILIALICYAFIFIWGTLLKMNVYAWLMNNRDPGMEPTYWSINPIKTYADNIRGYGVFHFIMVTIFNLLICVPIGLAIPAIFDNRKFMWVTIISLPLIAAVELLEPLAKLGTFDALDILINYLGAVLGYYLYRILIKKLSFKAINITGLVCLCLSLPIALFGLINTLVHIEYYL